MGVNVSALSRKVLLASVIAAVVALAAGCSSGDRSTRPILFMSDRDGEWALYAMDADGRSQHRVMDAGRVEPFGSGIGFGEPAVSPDGRKVALARHGVTVANLATGATRRLAAGEEASVGWSPDSKRVAFSGPQGEGLYVADVDSGRVHALRRTWTTWTPTWSPDAKWIAFVRQIGYEPTDVVIVHPDGSELIPLTDYSPTADSRLTWSRDGKLAFIGAHGDEDARLVVVDVPTGRVKVLRSGLSDGTVAWSPDGGTIAYAATTTRSETTAIYTVRADRTGRRRLTPSDQLPFFQAPVWSADGKSLLFVLTPVGGGPESGLPQIWTMRSDGTQKRRLTRAFPDGGRNVEPTFVRGPVHAEPAAQAEELQRGNSVMLRVPFPVDGIAADGGRAAIAPAHETQDGDEPTPPILAWRPAEDAPVRVLASGCGSVDQLVLSGDRLAFDCSYEFVDLVAQSVWVADLRTRVPREVFLGHAGNTGGLYLDHVVGSGGMVAFGTHSEDARAAVRRRTLWRIYGFDSVALDAGRNTGNVVAANGRYVAVELAGDRIAVLTPSGTLVRTLAVPRPRPTSFALDQESPYLLAGRELLVIERRSLRAFDTKSGKPRWQRRVPPGAQLEAAADGLVVYTTGSDIHLVSRGDDRTVHTGAVRLRRLRFDVQRIVHAAVDKNGLYYCFNVRDDRYPGRVVFVPWSALAP